MEDTIAAVSTPFGEGAVALLRLSGPDAVAIANELFRGSTLLCEAKPRSQIFGKLYCDGEVVDEVLATVFRKPASYTGEDMVEIGCHGGILITQRVLKLFLEKGARAAEPGEFTQRAFLNSKMDLTQAEAVMDLIRAQTNLALRAATEQLEGRLGEKVRMIREELLEILAHVEAYIDFPDEDIDPKTGEALLRKVRDVLNKVDELLQTADQGRILREGVQTVIYGAPNVGKSSLLNLLLGYDRAIVSEIPGTTRDSIEEVINLKGIPIRLIDTAGVRQSDDRIEKEGISRTLKLAERADLVLHLADGSRPKSQVLWASEQGTNKKEILILNKMDQGEHESWSETEAVRISCREVTGLDELGDKIFHRVMGNDVDAGTISVAINARHQACLNSAAVALGAACKALETGLMPELLAVELRAAMDAIGEVVGKADTEEILGKIFSTFCIGK